MFKYVHDNPYLVLKYMQLRKDFMIEVHLYLCMIYQMNESFHTIFTIFSICSCSNNTTNTKGTYRPRYGCMALNDEITVHTAVGTKYICSGTIVTVPMSVAGMYINDRALYLRYLLEINNSHFSYHSRPTPLHSQSFIAHP
jgi:hypothetical protein